MKNLLALAILVLGTPGCSSESKQESETTGIHVQDSNQEVKQTTDLAYVRPQSASILDEESDRIQRKPLLGVEETSG